ncbi:MAG: hypothetical protein RL196_269 [Actinomycetota bacterium]|jgi:hypothetical protein
MSKEFRKVTVPIEAVPDPESAKKHRARQTLNNLLLALAASVGIVLVIVLATPRNDTNQIKSVDYVAIANAAEADSLHVLAKPTLPQGWKSNAARWTPAPDDAVQNWYAGFFSPTGDYIGLTQAFGVNPTWLALETGNLVLASEFQVGDQTWQEFKTPIEHNPAQTKDYMIVWKYGENAVLLYGTAEKVVFNDFANQLVTQLKGQN